MVSGNVKTTDNISSTLFTKQTKTTNTDSKDFGVVMNQTSKQNSNKSSNDVKTDNKVDVKNDEYGSTKNEIKADNETIKSADDITSDTIIGVQQGNTADNYCQDEYSSSTLKPYTKFLQATLDLDNDKIDCIMMDSLPAAQLVAQNPDLKILEKEVFTDKYAIAVQKGNTEMLEQINSTLNRLIEEGKIDEFTIKHSN